MSRLGTHFGKSFWKWNSSRVDTGYVVCQRLGIGRNTSKAMLEINLQSLLNKMSLFQLPMTHLNVFALEER